MLLPNFWNRWNFKRRLSYLIENSTIIMILDGWLCGRDRGSYMSVHVLLNLLNKLGKRDKMRGLPSILSLFRNEFNKIR